MNSKEITQILKLNELFYQSVSGDFSKTRQEPWEGWGRVCKTIVKTFNLDELNNGQSNLKNDGKNTSCIKILDLGCGNGRFLKYIRSKIKSFDYTGIDINNDLLLEAEKIEILSDKQKRKFIKKDVILDIKKIKGKYNVVTIFGLTHHIPDKNFRKKWFENLPRLLSNPALLIITFWEFDKKPGDYILGWGQQPKETRFCHKYSVKEIKEIEDIFKNSGLKLIEKYKSDNKNLYLIFGKI